MHHLIARSSIDLPFVIRMVGIGLTIVVFAFGTHLILEYYSRDDWARIFVDAHVYHRATELWLAGGDPWSARWAGVPFAAPPPALLLNLPLIPFGEDVAVATWVVGSVVAIWYLLRQLRLPAWWALFLPVSEGFLGASPDLVLAAATFAGAGALAALIKPYAIPAMIADRRWWSLVGASVLILASFLFLPWRTFLDAGDALTLAFAEHTLVVSSLGSPILMLASVVALVSLGPRGGLLLATPALLAMQPHYMVFALAAFRESRVLSWTAALPVQHAAALGVIAHAAIRLVNAGRGSRDSLP